MHENELKSAIRSKRRGMLTNGVVLHHDNARPHTAAAADETIRKLKCELFLHSAYGPDLAPSDYHIFGLLKDALRGRGASRTTVNILRRWRQEGRGLI
jgi:histone-lysine N-methyltransferase SETMAR